MISALIKTWLAPYETYIWAALSVALVVAGGVFVHHERVIGENRIIAADAEATKAAHDAVLKEEAALKAKANEAESNRESAQKALDDYVASHSVGHVVVCKQNSGSKGVSQTPSSVTSPAGAIPGSSAVHEVSDGIDIGGHLDSLMRAAGSLATLYRQCQVTYANP